MASANSIIQVVSASSSIPVVAEASTKVLVPTAEFFTDELAQAATSAANALGSATAAAGSATGAATSASHSATSAALSSASYDAIAAAIAGYPAGGVPPIPVATRALLKGIASPVGSYIVYADGPVAAFVTDTWANLSADAANQGATEWYYVQSTTDPTKGFRRDGPKLTPYMAGCVGGGTVDDYVAFQAFNDFAFKIFRRETIDFSGDFGVSQTVTIGPSAIIADRLAPHWKVVGDCRLKALAALNNIAVVQNLDSVEFDGHINATGTGSGTWSTRTCINGIRVSNCAHAILNGGLSASTVMLNGVYAPSDGTHFNDCMVIANVYGFYCGSGPAQTLGQCIQSNWSAVVNNGTTNSTLQSTTLSLDVLPPASFDSYITWGSTPVAVWINEEPYKVLSIDRVNSKITIGHWLDSAVAALGTGTLVWVMGAVWAVSGGDSGVITINHLEAVNNGVGCSDAALYGTRVVSCNIENTTCAFAIGSIGGAHNGSDVSGGYTLDNVKAHAIQFGASGTKNFLLGNYGTDIRKLFSLNGARNASDVISTAGQMDRNIVMVDGVAHEWSQPQVANALPAGISLDLSLPPRPIIVTGKDVLTCTIKNVSDGRYNQLFGNAGGIVLISGSGLNDAPTSTMTWAPPTSVRTGPGITSGSATVTVPLIGLGTRGMAVGMPVSGTGIPAGATIATIPNRTSFTIDAGHLPTATNANATLTFTGSINGTFGNVAFQGFEGPVVFRWALTASFEMQWSVRVISGQRPVQVVQTSGSTAYAPALSDHATLKRMAATSAITVTLPSDATTAFPVGAYIDFAQENTGVITFAAGSGAAVQSRGSLVNSNGLHAVVRAEKTVANTWSLTGDRA